MMKTPWLKNVLRVTLLWGSACLLLNSPLHAGTSADIQELKQKVDNLYNTNQKNYADVARAMSLLTQIQQEFQSIRGTLDASKVLRQESDKVYQDLDMRVSALEDKVDQIHKLLKELKTADSSTAKPSAANSSKEFEEFQSMLNLVNAQDYNAAASGFLGYLRKYPQSANAGSAQYWVAESYYSLGDYAKAISEFQKLNEKYPQHPKVKEGIYKQGLAFMRVKKYPEAKLFFQKVMASYPNSPEALQAKAQLLRIQELEQATPNLASNQPATSSVSPPAAAPIPKGQAPNPNPTAPQPPSSTTGEGEPTLPQDSNAPLF
jgi:tol-pal system protein YbgF